MEQKYNNTQHSPDNTNGPGMNEWIPLKESATIAGKCTQTIRSAIKRNEIVARKVGEAKNALIEVSRASLMGWLGMRVNSPDSGMAVPPVVVERSDSPHCSENNSSRKKRSRSHKPLPRDVRLLIRWKNYMRKASPTQMISMIAWLSARVKTAEKGRSGKQKARGKFKERVKAARCRKDKPSRRHRQNAENNK